jgi:hypothetical protein
MDPDRRRLAALELLQDRQAGKAELLLGREAEVRRPDYWTALAPELTIGGPTPPPEPVDLGDETLAFARREGYFRGAGLLGAERVAPMGAAVQAVAEAGWAPIFALVYDEFWHLPWSAAPRAVAEALLGPGPRLLPNVAVHLVDARTRRSGWKPHRDGPGQRGRVTTWVALVDATAENGCIFVVPRNEVTAPALDTFDGREPRFEDVQRLLHEVRAITAPAGSVLAWDFDLIHWGSVGRSVDRPRISVAFEWIGDQGEATDRDQPLLTVDGDIPDFEQRLALIARAVLSYPEFDGELAPYAELARRLAA